MSLSVDISQKFGAFDLNVSFDAPAGVTVLFGRSGSGKSTVINAVAGLVTPDQGRIQIGERTLFDVKTRVNLPPQKRGLGYIFQDARLFPHLTVKQNLRYGQWFARGGKSTADFARIVDMLGIGPLLKRRPNALSGGEKQRVAIGRALLSQPQMILADEPLAALDQARKNEILPYFERLRDETDTPILYVTHAAVEVARLATSVVVLDAGRVRRQGAAAEVLGDPNVTPTGPRDAGAVLMARVSAHHEDHLTELDAGGVALFLPQIARPVGAKIRVRIAAHEVMISRQKPLGISALNILPATVATLRSGDGPGAMVSLDTPAGAVLARITQRSVGALGLSTGSECYAVIKSISIAPQDVG